MSYCRLLEKKNRLKVRIPKFRRVFRYIESLVGDIELVFTWILLREEGLVRAAGEEEILPSVQAEVWG